MSRDVADEVVQSVEMPQLKVAELYEIRLRDGTTYYFTSHHKAIRWGAAGTFSHWSGDASGTTNPTTITMDADKTVGAHFI